MDSQRKSLKMAKINFLCSMGLWYVKINPPQNMDQSTSLERSYKELVNALTSSEISHS